MIQSRTTAPWRLRSIFAAQLAAVIALSATLAAPAAAYDNAALTQRVFEAHILPGYTRFAKTAEAFAASAATLCAERSPATLQAAREAARNALAAWGEIEHIRFGPITQDQRLDRLLFYPDARGVARKQIATRLRRHDAKDLEPDRLAHASVAVQGFTAVDYVLFGKGSDALAGKDAKAGFRCDYVRALADGIAAIAAATLTDWSGPYKHVWLKPGPDNKAYLTPKEPTQALLRAFVTELEVVRLQRFGPALGAGAEGHAKILLPSSNLGLPFMIANVAGVRHLLTDGGFLDASFAETDPERSAVAVLGSVATDLGFAIRAGDNALKIAPDPFADEKALAALTPMLYALENSEDTGRSALTALTGQALGFNSLDGD